MFKKFSLLFKVLQDGGQVADTKFWARGQAYCLPVVAGLLLGAAQLAQGFGWAIPLDQETAMWLAGVLYFVINSAITIASHPALGLPTLSKKSAQVVAEVPQPREEPLPRIVEEATEAVQDAIVDEAQDLAADQLAKANEWLKRYGK